MSAVELRREVRQILDEKIKRDTGFCITGQDREPYLYGHRCGRISAFNEALDAITEAMQKLYGTTE